MRLDQSIAANRLVIAFDIYGTIVDPAGITEHLTTLFGGHAQEAAMLWRGKQIEYSFRRALMRRYVDFDVCIAQALSYVAEKMNRDLADSEKRALMRAYHLLPIFPDVMAAFDRLKKAGWALVGLTNGVEQSVRTALHRGKVDQYLDDIVSVDNICTFKPNPAVYQYLARRLRRSKGTIWFVSSNAWDVIGAKAYGLRTIWLRRDPGDIFDPWEFSPDLIIGTLDELSTELGLD